ncbi:MAG: Lrp/AsnC family transcriptional regulator [Euryarchaeota archaeon]|nr:Lrp/AsnC family transcriptional regulator [Euryarchaeota archaeon]
MDPKRELLDVLYTNARRSTEDLARQTGLAEDEVEAAISDLEDEKTIRGYQAIVDWEELDEDHARAAVELNVTLDRETGYSDVSGRLAKFPEVSSLHLVSGNYDFLMIVEASSVRKVSRFVSEKVAPVPEVTQTVTHFVMETYKEGGIEMREDGDDDRLSVSP